MFQKAEKSELLTWLIGDLILVICLAFGAVACIGGLFSEFTVGKLIWGIVFALLGVLFGSFLVKIIKALKTFDERSAEKAAIEQAEKERREAEENAKREQEQAEMEELIKQEEQKRAEMQALLEAQKAEAEARGEKFGEDDE